jgi:glycerate kinase
MAEGVARALPDAHLTAVPVADGGDGLVDVACSVLGAEVRRVRVTGPRMGPVDARLAWLPAKRSAIIEMALASGLALVPAAERDAVAATTLGTGELIRHALDLGARSLFVGIGGSATNDGGIGMATALGFAFRDRQGRTVSPTGAGLAAIDRIDSSGADPRLASARVEAVCDVDNPLTGPAGAARVYGPQKGASAEQVRMLDAGLAHLAALIRRDLGKDVLKVPGGGAAGGLGAGLLAFCGARLRPGAEVVLDLVELDRHLAGADLVLTAEGRIDAQTRFGKAPVAVAAHAARRGVPCIAIAGGIGDGIDALHGLGVDAVLSLCPGPISLDEAEARAEELLSRATEQAVRVFVAGARRPSRTTDSDAGDTRG